MRRESGEVEFVSEKEVMDLLRDHGITPSSHDEDRIYLGMAEGGDIVRIHLAVPDATIEPDAGAQAITVEQDRLAERIGQIIQELHLREILLIPVSRWRNVFDAVAFSMTGNEDWHEFDTTATVELNTRDPLLCEPADYQTVIALIRALLTDGEGPDQGLMLTTTAAPLLVEVIPDGAVRIALGNHVLADEVAEVFAAR